MKPQTPDNEVARLRELLEKTLFELEKVPFQTPKLTAFTAHRLADRYRELRAPFREFVLPVLCAVLLCAGAAAIIGPEFTPIRKTQPNNKMNPDTTHAEPVDVTINRLEHRLAEQTNAVAWLCEENAALKQGKVFVDPKWIYDLETQLADLRNRAEEAEAIVQQLHHYAGIIEGFKSQQTQTIHK
jgi:hypothetical protein